MAGLALSCHMLSPGPYVPIYKAHMGEAVAGKREITVADQDLEEAVSLISPESPLTNQRDPEF
jgi:hypothetical protein